MTQTAAPSFDNGNAIFNLLAESERQLIKPYLKIVEVTADESIYEYGDRIKRIYFPLSAVFSTSSLMEDGSSAEVSVTGSESAVGVFAAFGEHTSRHWTNVLLAGRAYRIESSVLRDLIRSNNQMSVALLHASRGLMAQVSQRAVCNGRHSLLQRFCFWLLLVHDRVKKDEILLTHETIAKKLCARRAGITNVAGIMQTAKAISYSRGTIQIINRQIIEDEACECYQLTSSRDREMCE